jgi:hypothetical protein
MTKGRVRLVPIVPLLVPHLAEMAKPSGAVEAEVAGIKGPKSKGRKVKGTVEYTSIGCIK